MITLRFPYHHHHRHRRNKNKYVQKYDYRLTETQTKSIDSSLNTEETNKRQAAALNINIYRFGSETEARASRREVQTPGESGVDVHEAPPWHRFSGYSSK